MPEMTYKQLKRIVHPDYSGPAGADYWRRCRALYAGGPKLLRDPEVLKDVLPRHLNEPDKTYQERCHRAFHVGHPGKILDLICAGLFEEQPGMALSPPAVDPPPDGSAPEPPQAPSIPQWYADWFKNVAPRGAQKTSFSDLLKTRALEALLVKRAWTLVDLPSMPEDGMPRSILDQEQTGALNAYCQALPAEAVRDWDIDSDGRLLWALVHFATRTRADLSAGRNLLTEEFTYYTPTEWQRYEIRWDTEKSKGPRDSAVVPLVGEGRHTFGRVPLVVLEVSDGLWAMSKLESIACAHINTRNALSWAEWKSLFAVRHVFKGPADLNAPLSEDQGRGMNPRPVGAGSVELTDKDRVEYPAPSVEPFAHALADLERLVDDMYSVTHMMAAHVTNTASAVGRSGLSKKMDSSHGDTVLKYLGELVQKHGIEICEVVGKGRGDEALDWIMTGMEEFHTVDLDGKLKLAQALALVEIKSPTFHALHEAAFAKDVLGDNATGDQLEQIRKECVQNNPPESFRKEAPGAADDAGAAPTDLPPATGDTRNRTDRRETHMPGRDALPPAVAAAVRG